jgi:NTP pyrophosphatase (non-canonical NTP hydrolase)
MNTLIKAIIEFRDNRDWKKHDSPENLAKSIIIEAAELLENFQWDGKSFDEVNVREELADVLIYSLALVHDLGYDLEEIIKEKLLKNAIKYPITK